MITFALWSLIAILFILGLLGSLIPLLPAPFFTLAAVLVFVFWKGMAALGVFTFIALILLAILAMLADNLASILGAKKYGASKRGMMGAVLGALVGLLFGGPFGVILGPLLGAFLFEYAFSGDIAKARRIGWGTFVGFLTGTVARFVISIIIISWFLIKVF